MGKKRIEVIQKIDDYKIRKVTYCKRKKGLLKKSMELSVLCDLRVFLYIFDPNQQRVIHFASHPDLDLLDLFNLRNQREYYSNLDYEEIGGRFLNELDLDASVNDGASDSAPEKEEASNAAKRKVPFQTKQGRIKRDQEKKSSQLGNLISQRMTIPRNHIQKVILEDARTDQVVQQVEQEQAERVVKRMSTSRIFITEKPDNILGKAQPQQILSSAILNELDQLEHEKLQKIFSEEFHLLKEAQPLFQQLLDRIVCDKDAMSYIKAVMDSQSEKLVCSTGVGALGLNIESPAPDGQVQARLQNSQDRALQKLSGSLETKADASLLKLGGSTTPTRMDQGLSANHKLESQCSKVLPLLQQRQESPPQLQKRTHILSSTDPYLEKKLSPAKMSSEKAALCGMTEEGCTITMHEFIKIFDAMLSNQDKQLVLDFGASAIELNQTFSRSSMLSESHKSGSIQPRQSFKDRLLQLQTIALNQVLFMLHSYKKIAKAAMPGATGQPDAQEMGQVLRMMQEHQQLKQLYLEEAAKERPAVFRYVDTKPQEMRKRDAKALQKQCEQPLVKYESSERQILNLSSSNQVGQSSHKSRPLVRLSSNDVLLGKKHDEQRPIRYGLPTQSFRSSKYQQQSLQAGPEGQSALMPLADPKQVSSNSLLPTSRPSLKKDQSSFNMFNQRKSEQIQMNLPVQQLPKRGDPVIPKENGNVVAEIVNGQFKLQNVNKMMMEAAASIKPAPQQRAPAQAANLGEQAQKQLPDQSDIGPQGQVGQPANAQPKQHQLRDFRPGRKRLTTGELMTDKNAQFDQKQNESQANDAQVQLQPDNIQNRAAQHEPKAAVQDHGQSQHAHGGLLQPPSALDGPSEYPNQQTPSMIQPVNHVADHSNLSSNYLAGQKTAKRDPSQPHFHHQQGQKRLYYVHGKPAQVLIQSLSSQRSSDRHQLHSQWGQPVALHGPGGQAQSQRQSTGQLKAAEYSQMQARDFNEAQQNSFQAPSTGQLPLQYQQPHGPAQNKLVATLAPPSGLISQGTASAGLAAQRNFLNLHEYKTTSPPRLDENEQYFKSQKIELKNEADPRQQLNPLHQPDDLLINQHHKLLQYSSNAQLAPQQQITLAKRIETSSLSKYYSYQSNPVKQHQFYPSKRQRISPPPHLQQQAINRPSPDLENNSEQCIEVLIKGNSVYRKISNMNSAAPCHQPYLHKMVHQDQHLYYLHSSDPRPGMSSHTPPHFKHQQVDDASVFNKIQQMQEQISLNPKHLEHQMQNSTSFGNNEDRNMMHENMAIFSSNSKGQKVRDIHKMQVAEQYMLQQPIMKMLGAGEYSARGQVAGAQMGQMQAPMKQVGRQCALVSEQRQSVSEAKMPGEEEQVYGQAVVAPGSKIHSQRLLQRRQQSNLSYGDLPAYQQADVDEKVYERRLVSPKGKFAQERGAHDCYKELPGLSGTRSGATQRQRHLALYKNTHGPLKHHEAVSHVHAGHQKGMLVKKNANGAYEIVDNGEPHLTSTDPRQLHTLVPLEGLNHNDMKLIQQQNALHANMLGHQSAPPVHMSHDESKAVLAHDHLNGTNMKMNDQQVLQLLQNNAQLHQQLPGGDVPFFANVNHGEHHENIVHDHGNNQQYQQQWCQRSVITQDTMSDISKLNLTSISMINKQANEQDKQADMERQGQDNNMDNVSQMRKLKVAQERKQNGRQQVNNFHQKYKIMQQTVDYQKMKQVAEIGPQQSQVAAPNAHFVGNCQEPPDSQEGRHAFGQNEAARGPQPQVTSQQHSSLMDIQNQEDQQMERKQSANANMDDNNDQAAQHRFGASLGAGFEIHPASAPGGEALQHRAGCHKQNMESVGVGHGSPIPNTQKDSSKHCQDLQQSKRLQNELQTQTASHPNNTDLGKDLKQTVMQESTMPAQTENQINKKAAVEHTESQPSPQAKEPTYKKAVNLLKDMDTDNISDNASNYTMFLVNSTNPRAAQQQNQDQKGNRDKEQFEQAQRQRNFANTKNASQQLAQNPVRIVPVHEITHLQILADIERSNTRKQEGQRQGEPGQTQSAQNTANVFMKPIGEASKNPNNADHAHHKMNKGTDLANGARSEENAEDDNGGDVGSQTHSASAHSDFQYRNIRRPIKHEVTGCFAKYVDLKNSKSQSVTSYQQQNNNAQAAENQPQDKATNLRIPQRFESHISFFKNQQDGAAIEGQLPAQLPIGVIQAAADAHRVESNDIVRYPAAAAMKIQMAPQQPGDLVPNLQYIITDVPGGRQPKMSEPPGRATVLATSGGQYHPNVRPPQLYVQKKVVGQGVQAQPAELAKRGGTPKNKKDYKDMNFLPELLRDQYQREQDLVRKGLPTQGNEEGDVTGLSAAQLVLKRPLAEEANGDAASALMVGQPTQAGAQRHPLPQSFQYAQLAKSTGGSRLVARSTGKSQAGRAMSLQRLIMNQSQNASRQNGSDSESIDGVDFLSKSMSHNH